MRDSPPNRSYPTRRPVAGSARARATMHDLHAVTRGTATTVCTRAPTLDLAVTCSTVG